jgi:hypothetical protein
VRFADFHRLTAEDRRRMGLRTNEPGTCAWCGVSLGKAKYGDGYGGYDELWCTMECARWFARAAHRHVEVRFKPVEERGGPVPILKEQIEWYLQNPGEDPDQQDYRRGRVEHLQQVLAAWLERTGEGEGDGR